MSGLSYDAAPVVIDAATSRYRLLDLLRELMPWSRGVLPYGQLCTLAALVDLALPESLSGVAWCGLLARSTRYEESTVRRYVGSLARCGLVDKASAPGVGGFYYRIPRRRLLELLADLVAAHPTRRWWAAHGRSVAVVVPEADDDPGNWTCGLLEAVVEHNHHANATRSRRATKRRRRRGRGTYGQARGVAGNRRAGK